MSARCNCFRNGAMPVIDEVLRRKYLLRGHNIVIPCSEQKHWTVQLGEIDPPAQRDEISGGQTVLLEYLFNDLQVIAAWQIHRPRVPVMEARTPAAEMPSTR